MTCGAAVNRELQYHVLRFGADLPDGTGQCRLCSRIMTMDEWAAESQCPGQPVIDNDPTREQERAALQDGTKGLEVEE